jgi:hypothetical protein
LRIIFCDLKLPLPTGCQLLCERFRHLVCGQRCLLTSRVFCCTLALSHTIESSQRGAEKDALPSLVFSGAICVGHTSGTHYKRRKLIEAWRTEDVFKAINLCICYFCVYLGDSIVFQQSGWTKDIEKTAGRHHPILLFSALL